MPHVLGSHAQAAGAVDPMVERDPRIFTEGHATVQAPDEPISLLDLDPGNESQRINIIVT